MTTKDEALQAALDALCRTFPTGKYERELEQVCRAAIAACREALAQKDEQEPVAWRFKERPDESRSAWHYVAKKKSVPHGFPYQSLYTAPPNRQPTAWIHPGHLDEARKNPFMCRVEPTQRIEYFIPIYTK